MLPLVLLSPSPHTRLWIQPSLLCGAILVSESVGAYVPVLPHGGLASLPARPRAEEPYRRGLTSDPRALGSRSAKSTTCSRAPPPSGLRCSMGISAHTAEQGQRHTRRLAAPGLRPSLRHPSLCHCQGHTFSVKATGQPRPTSDGFRPLRTAHTGHPGPLPSPARPLALLRTLETPHGGTLLLRRPRRLGAPRCVRAVSARGAGLYGDVETVGPRAASGGLPR